ncbi:hypothetical protein L6R52_27090 [Myxococcota bacterium]|nr:hypothetical protein [Myxococcota bacterium]
MLNTLLYCHACGGEIELIDKVKRADTCEHCGVDLHSCKNCKFYDPYAHNGCRESSTLYEPDKVKANFCTYFVPRDGKIEVEDKGAALNKLEALFKKKK